MWMLIQAAVFAGGMWFEFKLSSDLGEQFNLVRGSVFDIFGALAVTALSVDAIPRLIGWFRRMVSPPVTVARDIDTGPIGFPAISADDGQASREGQRLAAPGRGGRDVPKITSNRQIG